MGILPRKSPWLPPFSITRFDLRGLRDGSIIKIKMNMPPTRPLISAEEQFIATYREIMRVSREQAQYAYMLSDATRVAAAGQGMRPSYWATGSNGLS